IDFELGDRRIFPSMWPIAFGSYGSTLDGIPLGSIWDYGYVSLKMIHLLYPSSPLKARLPDELYAEEVECVREAGFDVSLFSFEYLQAGEFRAVPSLPQSKSVLYRGWMLNKSDYAALTGAMIEHGAQPFTDTKTYLACHHLPNWYSKIAHLTPETHMFGIDCDLKSELQRLGWSEFFVKDYVKSLKTGTGSRITDPSQIEVLAENMRRFKGEIEGGFCIRRVEAFQPETERRFFVVNHKPYGVEDAVPEIVKDCARKIESRFFSVDVISRDDGELRVVEIGDGQVSGTVGWTPQRFAAVLKDGLE
ncbi:MAG TPA: ATP-grasp domain-containing protein, partial [Pirellula sp.]|nr:ATP-grasp domain-containing protein [Pirellula sp.]